MKVVVADDDHHLANEMRRGLLSLGHEVVAVVSDGLQAIEACRETRPDVALFDYEMPNLDGLAAARQVVQSLGIPVIIVTVHEDRELIGTAVQFGVSQYLLKPVTRLGLHAAIMTALGKNIPLKGERQSLEELKVIEQAKRILMTRGRLSEEQAYQVLWADSGGRRADIHARSRSIVESEALFSTRPAEPASPDHPPASPGRQDPGLIEIFFSYSHRDRVLRDEIEKHLANLKRQHLIGSWHDREIGAGDEWRGRIDERLNRADLILLLISSDFIASDYCVDVEMKRALERHDRGEAIVIPIILRPVDWTKTSFGHLQPLPTWAKPVTRWRNRDEAYLDIAEGIRNRIERPSTDPPRTGRR